MPTLVQVEGQWTSYSMLSVCLSLFVYVRPCQSLKYSYHNTPTFHRNFIIKQMVIQSGHIDPDQTGPDQSMYARTHQNIIDQCFNPFHRKLLEHHSDSELNLEISRDRDRLGSWTDGQSTVNQVDGAIGVVFLSTFLERSKSILISFHINSPGGSCEPRSISATQSADKLILGLYSDSFHTFPLQLDPIYMKTQVLLFPSGMRSGSKSSMRAKLDCYLHLCSVAGP